MRIKDCISFLIPSNSFFNKEATIKEYFDIVPAEKRIKTNSYEDLYKEALRVVGKQNFEENTADLEDYFITLSLDEGTIAVLVGLLAFAIAIEIDTRGLEYEQAIDKLLPNKYDQNNPFDVKQGFGHRIFGHDPLTFGIKNIPGDLLIRVKSSNTEPSELVKIGDFIGVGTDNDVSMFQLIWKFYGNDSKKMQGFANCLGHTIVHFGKDLLTPAGIPLPLTTLFNEYKYWENQNCSSLSYKDSLMQKMCDKRMQLKASDIASLVFIESVLSFYFQRKGKENISADLKNDMKLIAMGTCLSMQMATLIVMEPQQKGKKGPKAMIPGGKVNVLLASAFFKETIQEMFAIQKGWKNVYAGYDN